MMAAASYRLPVGCGRMIRVAPSVPTVRYAPSAVADSVTVPGTPDSDGVRSAAQTGSVPRKRATVASTPFGNWWAGAEKSKTTGRCTVTASDERVHFRPVGCPRSVPTGPMGGSVCSRPPWIHRGLPTAAATSERAIGTSVMVTWWWSTSMTVGDTATAAGSGTRPKSIRANPAAVRAYSCMVPSLI